MALLLGWCMTGNHANLEDDDPRTRCPGTRQWTGKTITCDCSCHGGTDADTTALRTSDDPL